MRPPVKSALWLQKTFRQRVTRPTFDGWRDPKEEMPEAYYTYVAGNRRRGQQSQARKAAA